MTTFVIRRLMQGALVLFLSSFVIYTILILTPGGPQDQLNALLREQAGGRPVNKKLIEIYTRWYGLDKPYPINYLVWLFDPNDTMVRQYDIHGNVYTSTKG